MIFIIRLGLLFIQGLMLSIMMEALQLDNMAKMIYAVGMALTTGAYGAICAVEVKVKDVKDE